MNILDKLKALIAEAEGDVAPTLHSLAAAIEADAKAAIAELESMTAQQAEAAGVTIGEAALTGLAAGGPEAAFAAGVAAAPAALEAAGKAVSKATVNTLVASVVNQLQAAQAATVATPTA